LFLLGDGFQQTAANWTFEFFNPRTWTPANLTRLAAIGGQRAMRTSQLFVSPWTLQNAWLELRNKIEVFFLVQNINSILGIPNDRFVPLCDLVEKAYSLPPFQALWAVEGVGHAYAEAYSKMYGLPQGLLLQKNAPVPEKSLLMLHAGMGLFFADYLLGVGTPALTSVSPPDEFRAVVAKFIRLSRSNARPGYLGPVVESLGLETKDFYPEMVDAVHQQLLQLAPELVGYYWHGVGRALYFSRRYFVPVLSSVWAGIDSEARTAPERLSATAGLAWALVLVNMRQPQIIEDALWSSFQDSPDQAFINGVASSVIVRQDVTPDESFISAFYKHQVRNRELSCAWDHFVAQPCRLALTEYYPALKQQDALGELFRFQDLAARLSDLNQGQVLTGRKFGAPINMGNMAGYCD
jgi:hypothetical protein